MATKVRVEGLRELEAALKELPKATGKRVLRNSLRKARAPVDDGTLRDSIGVGTRLTKRQAGLHRKMFRDDRASVEMFVGAGGLAQATQMEFGNFKDSPQPYMRPAWDGNKMQALETIKTELWNEIQKAAARHARKMARLAAKG
jgi:hypothetical protein